MATAGHRQVGTEACARGGVACSQRQHKGFDANAARTLGFGTVDCVPTSRPSRSTSSRVDVCTYSSLCPCAPAFVAANHVWPFVERARCGGVEKKGLSFGGGRCPSVLLGDWRNSSLFFCLLFVEFWWCLKRGDPEMCTFGLSSPPLRSPPPSKPPPPLPPPLPSSPPEAPRGPPLRRTPPLRGTLRWGFTQQPENSKREHFRVSALKHHRNSTKRPLREGKKSAKCWALPPLRGPPFGAPTFEAPTLRGPTIRQHVGLEAALAYTGQA